MRVYVLQNAQRFQKYEKHQKTILERMQQQVLRETEQRKALEDEIKELRKEIDVVRNCDHIFLQLSRVFECVPLCAPVCVCDTLFASSIPLCLSSREQY